MSEFPTEPNYEEERLVRLSQLVDRYLPDDRDFFFDMDEEDKLSYVFGALLEAGEDPEEILRNFGVIV